MPANGDHRTADLRGAARRRMGLPLGVLSAWLFFGVPLLSGVQEAVASEAADAERYRLEMELDRHARALRWKGVERTYEKLLGLQVPVSTHAHYTAALSSESQGDVTETWTRLERAIRHENALGVQPDGDGFTPSASVPVEVDLTEPQTKRAFEHYDGLTQRYGRVSIVVGKGRIAVLVRMGAKPFGSVERKAITSGQKALAQEHRYVGLLPVGKYMVDGEIFDVVPGELVVVRVEAS